MNMSLTIANNHHKCLGYRSARDELVKGLVLGPNNRRGSIVNFSIFFNQTPLPTCYKDPTNVRIFKIWIKWLLNVISMNEVIQTIYLA